MAPASTPGHNATKTVTPLFPSEFYKRRPAGPNARCMICMMVVTLEGLLSLTASGALFDIGIFRTGQPCRLRRRIGTPRAAFRVLQNDPTRSPFLRLNGDIWRRT